VRLKIDPIYPKSGREFWEVIISQTLSFFRRLLLQFDILRVIRRCAEKETSKFLSIGSFRKPIGEATWRSQCEGERDMVSQNDHPKQESDEGVSAMNKSLKLDKDELEILRDFERGELESMKNFRDEKRKLEEAARHMLQKDKRINIRLSSRDLETIQKKAAKEGIPYQTLISSTLHKFVTGKLKSVG
jgi:predicted DNA binding CopG/RHH family protein